MYLLKLEFKENNLREAFSVSLTHNYYEFEQLEEIIEYMHKNAHIIENYKIYEAKELKNKDEKLNLQE